MKAWERALVSQDMTLRDVLSIIDGAGTQMAMVVDHRRRLLGTLSDGDIRRGLLRGLQLNEKVLSVMHLNPTVARSDQSGYEILMTMRQRNLHQIPVVDCDGIVIGMKIVDDFLSSTPRENWVVIMAGGLGRRLQHLTIDTPKPMLQVGARPLLETIVAEYSAHGFHRFYFAVNYKSEQIKQHFGNGERFGVEIRYLQESIKLGTAGGLSLLPEIPTQPFLVTNADLLAKEDFGNMLDQHTESGADATMGVRSYEMQVPFGVVQLEDGYIKSIDEKPLHRFTVSAGIYVLSPKILEFIPKDTEFDMPTLFESVVRRGLRARCHRIDGYWLDIGCLPDYERANMEYNEIFDDRG